MKRSVSPRPTSVALVGLTIRLVGLTIGVGALLFFEQSFLAWALVIASLFVGWVSFLYCVV